MSIVVNNCPIVVGVVARPDSDWRGALSSVASLGITEIALFLTALDFEGRRDLYRSLDGAGLVSVPYVQLAADTKDWEPLYLSEKFGTSAFSVAARADTAKIISSLGEAHHPILLENPEEKAAHAFFSDETISAAGAAGICLDAGALERDRLRDKKSYQSVIAALDHNSIGATFITPVFESRWREMMGHPQRLSSLSQLHYVKHFPAAYLSKIVALKLDNSLEEQLEVRAYLESFLRRNS